MSLYSPTNLPITNCKYVSRLVGIAIIKCLYIALYANNVLFMHPNTCSPDARTYWEWSGAKWMQTSNRTTLSLMARLHFYLINYVRSLVDKIYANYLYCRSPFLILYDSSVCSSINSWWLILMKKTMPKRYLVNADSNPNFPEVFKLCEWACAVLIGTCMFLQVHSTCIAYRVCSIEFENQNENRDSIITATSVTPNI